MLLLALCSLSYLVRNNCPESVRVVMSRDMKTTQQKTKLATFFVFAVPFSYIPYLLDQTPLLSSRCSQIVASTSHVFSEIDAALK